MDRPSNRVTDLADRLRSSSSRRAAYRTAFAALAAAMTVQVPTMARAGGFNLDHQNAAALGAAFAGAEATRSQAAFAAYNPAAIGVAGHLDVALSVTGVFPSSEYSDASATLLGVAPVAGQSASDGTIQNAAIPNFSLSYTPIEHLSFGLVVNTPFGLDTEYTDGSILRYQAQRTALLAVEVTPIVAYEIWPGIVAAAGVRVQYVDLSVTSIIDAGGIAAANSIPGFAPGSSDMPASFNGDDTAVGYTLGIQASPHRMIDLGVAYFSAIEHSIGGNSHFALGSSVAGQTLNGLTGVFSAENFDTKIDTPASLAIGLRLNATDRLRVLFSERVMFWSRFDIVSLSFDDGVTPNERLTQNWRDSTMTSLGVEYDLPSRTTLRAGYMYDESPVRGRFASPRIPDSDRHWISLGVSQSVTDQISADLGLAYAFFDERKIRLSGTATENTLRGSLEADIDSSAVAASLGVRYRF